MKYVCKQCSHHVEYTERESHAEAHNKSLVEPIPYKEMFDEVKFRCPSCFKEKATIRTGKLICQNCSHSCVPYIEIKEEAS